MSNSLLLHQTFKEIKLSQKQDRKLSENNPHNIRIPSADRTKIPLSQTLKKFQNYSTIEKDTSKISSDISENKPISVLSIE